MGLRKILMLGCVLVAFAATDARATSEPAAAGTPPMATTGSSADLPFINNGANQPVLQTISPDGVAIDPVAAAAAVPAPEGEHGAAEGHKKGLPQFDSTTFSKQLFWLFLTFVFLYFVYSKATLPRIASVIDGRAARVSGDLAQAEELKTQVEKIRQEYEAAMATAQSDAAKVIANVQADIKKMTETQDASFKAKAEDAVGSVEKKLDVSRTRILADLNTLAAELTVDIAARVAGVKTDVASAQNAIDGISARQKAA